MPRVIKLFDGEVIANNATVTRVLSVNDFAFAAVEETNDQTVDFNINASVEDAAARAPLLTLENNATQTRTGLTATTNGRVYVLLLRKVFRTLSISVTNKSGGADATVTVWVSLAS